jgi:hypothetical protein
VGTQFFFHELHLTGFIPNSWCIECLELKFCSHPIVTYPYLRIQAFMVLFFALSTGIHHISFCMFIVYLFYEELYLVADSYFRKHWNTWHLLI